MINNYFKIAIRSIIRHKLFTLINIIGLSIGISAALVIYLIINFDFSFDKFHKDSERIYRVVTNFTFQGEPAYNSGVCGPLAGAVNSQVTGLQEAAPLFLLSQTDVLIKRGRGSLVKFRDRGNVAFTTPGYFKLFNYKWLAGNSQTSLSSAYKVVLTSKEAVIYFPGLPYNAVIGKTVTYNNITTIVTGVVQSLSNNSDLTFTNFISYSTALTDQQTKKSLRLNNWGGTSPKQQLFLKTLPGSSVSNITAQLNSILKRNNPPREDTKGNTQSFYLQPLADIHFNGNYGVYGNGRTAGITMLFQLGAIALFLLLSGCINFINLSTAQGSQRAKEIGIRKTMGSSRRQLVLQFLGETFVISLLAVIAALTITPLILRLFAGFIPAGVKANYLQQPGIFIFSLLVLITVSFLSGFYPAVILSGYQPVSILKGQLLTGSQSQGVTLRRSLTVAQFIIAQFFIMATVIVSKQIYYAVNKDLGFKKEAIIIVNIPLKGRSVAGNAAFLNRLRAIPQVEMVSQGNDAPSSASTGSTEVTYTDGKKEIKGEVGEKFGDANYIRLYHIKLLAGRNLIAADTVNTLLINNKYAQVLGFKDPAGAVGKQLKNFNGDRQKTIVGVVADFHQESVHSTVEPLVILNNPDPEFSGTFHLALKPNNADGTTWNAAIASLQKLWKEYYPEDEFEYHFFDETIAELYTNEQHTLTLLNWATGLAVVISCLGLLGLTIYTTGRRTKEIGVRKVLGASVTRIVALLSSELVLLTLVSLLVVIPLAWYAMNKWEQGFADRTPISWWIFALSGIIMLLSALVTSGFQTIKAAMANPVNSLKSE